MKLAKVKGTKAVALDFPRTLCSHKHNCIAFGDDEQAREHMDQNILSFLLPTQCTYKLSFCLPSNLWMQYEGYIKAWTNMMYNIHDKPASVNTNDLVWVIVITERLSYNKQYSFFIEETSKAVLLIDVNILQGAKRISYVEKINIRQYRARREKCI